jgi:hypothetical protein
MSAMVDSLREIGDDCCWKIKAERDMASPERVILRAQVNIE